MRTLSALAVAQGNTSTPSSNATRPHRMTGSFRECLAAHQTRGHIGSGHDDSAGFSGGAGRIADGLVVW
jgi:hypothetical protein